MTLARRGERSARAALHVDAYRISHIAYLISRIARRARAMRYARDLPVTSPFASQGSRSRVRHRNAPTSHRALSPRNEAMPRLLPIGGGASTPKRMLAMPARPPADFGGGARRARSALFQRISQLKSCNSHTEFQRRASRIV
ncbi:hypothetical protein JAO05_11075 [Burkholderia pseudomallei]|nr:hypothetical protein [Burkholderia pseudomallei]